MNFEGSPFFLFQVGTIPVLSTYCKLEYEVIYEWYTLAQWAISPETIILVSFLDSFYLDSFMANYICKYSLHFL